MIIRKSDINAERTEVRFMQAFGAADVKRFVKLYGKIFFECYSDEQRLSHQHKEAFFREWVESHPQFFGNYETPWCQQLSAWLWLQMIRQGYFKQSATDPSVCYFTEKATKLMPHYSWIENL